MKMAKKGLDGTPGTIIMKAVFPGGRRKEEFP